MPKLIHDGDDGYSLYFYEVGDRVQYNYGPEAVEALTGTVTAVEHRAEGEHGEPEGQTLTVDWIVVGGITVAATKEYPQDLKPVMA